LTSRLVALAVACLPLLVEGCSGRAAERTGGGSESSGNARNAAGGSPAAPLPAGAITANDWLAAHNAARASAAPTPKPALPALTWNASAAAAAQDWANRCVWGHNSGRGNLGENIFAGTGSYTATQIVNDWNGEKAFYNRATNRCGTGKVCGHYTQLVWRGTTSVGCAEKLCSSGSPFGGGNWKSYVCGYSPPGNVVGQKPY